MLIPTMRALILTLLLVGTTAMAAGPSGGAIQGTLLGPGLVPVTSNSVDFQIQILDSTGTCVMYQEDHDNVDLSATNGDFTLDLGLGTNAVNNIDASNTLKNNVFRNDTDIAPYAGCPGGINLTNGDGRTVRVRFNTGSGLTLMTPDLELRSSPYSAVADSADAIQGKSIDSSSVSGVAGDNFAMLWDQGLNRWVARAITPSDIVSAAGEYFTYAPNNVACAVGQVLKWTAGNRWECAADATGAGGVTLVSGGTGLLGGNITGVGTLSVNVGTAANQIVQLNGSAQLPAVSGALLTNINAVALQGSPVSATAPAMSQVLKWNGSSWVPAPDSDSGGDITDVIAGTAILVGGAAFGDVTVSVDVGINANQIPQLRANGALSIGTATPTTGAIADFFGDAAATSSIVIPRATTANRPVTGVDGMIRYNTTLAKFEVYENGGWANMVNTGGSGDFLRNGSLAMTGNFRAGSQWISNDGDNEGLRIDNSGNVGVGTTTLLANAKLTVHNEVGAQASQSWLAITNLNTGTTASDGFWIGNDGTGPDDGAYLWNEETSPMLFGTDGTERMRISSNGNVGIGVAAPNSGAILDLNGTGNLSSLLVPRGTTAERAVTAANGMIRYNTNLAAFEVYANNQWATLSTGSVGATSIDGLTDGKTSPGTEVVYLGQGAGASGAAGAISNTAVGANALEGNITGDYNTAIGTNALRQTLGSNNVGIGEGAGFWAFGSSNIAVGKLALAQTQSGDSNIAIGSEIGAFTVSNSLARNVFIGDQAASVADGADDNVMLGFQVGGNLSSGDRNILIGPGIDLPSGSTSDHLNIGNTIVGNMAAKSIGIGTSNPNSQSALDINGTGNISNMLVPRGTSAERAVAAANGMIRYNTNLAKFEVYENGGWANMVATGSSPGGAVNEIQFNDAGTFNGVSDVRNLPLHGLEIGSNASAGTNGGVGLSFTTAKGAWFSSGSTGLNKASDGYLLRASGSNQFFELSTNEVNGGWHFLNSSAGNVMTILGSGNVGIGTTTPSAILHIAGTAGGISTGLVFGDGDTGFHENIDDNIAVALDGADRWFFTTSSMWTNTGSGPGLFGSSNAVLRPRYTEDTGIGRLGAHKLGIYTSGASRVMVDYNGGVGIGTTTWTEGAILDVNGSGTSFSSMIVPRDSTANRPATAQNGMIRYNTNLAAFEVYQNNIWATLATGSGGATSIDGLSDGVTSGSSMYLGDSAGSLASGTLNTVVGQGAFSSAGAGSGNTVMGRNALALGGGTSANTAIGNGSLDSLIAGGGNTSVGDDTLITMFSGSGNVAMGRFSLNFTSQGNENVALGASTGSGVGDKYRNVLVGHSAGAAATSADNNTMIGYQAGSNTTTGDFNVLVGSGALAPTPTTSNYLNIGNAIFGINLSGSGGVVANAQIAIGTTTPSPGAVLDIVGTGENYSSIRVPRDTTANRPTSAQNGMIRYNTNLSAFEVYANDQWATVATGSGGGSQWTTVAGNEIHYSTANVGVGTDNPTTKLHVHQNSAADAVLTLSNTVTGAGAGSGTTVGVDTGGNGSLWNHEATDLYFGTDNTERMLIDLNGNVGIGTSGPTNLLHIHGTGNTTASIQTSGGASDRANLLMSTPSLDGFLIAHEAGASSWMQLTTYSNHSLMFGTNNVERVRILGNGVMGIGTTNPNEGAALDVFGTGNMTSMIVPRGTTAERAVAATNGMIRYNTNLAAFEVYANNQWAIIATGSGGGATDIDGLSDAIYQAGTNSIYVGNAAGNPAATGTWNTALGDGAMDDVTVGSTNTALGRFALGTETIGDANTAVGAQALLDQNGASWNTAVGSLAGRFITSGSGNTAVGQNSMVSNTSGSDNTAIGENAMASGTFTGVNARNTAVGSESFSSVTTGANDNTLMGFAAGSSITTGDQNIAIGSGAQVPSATSNGQLSIGNAIYGLNLTGTGSNISPANIGIGTDTPLTGARLDVYGTGVNFSSLLVPRDSTANRPAGVNGMIRYNTTLAKFEVYENGDWANMVGGGAADNLGDHTATQQILSTSGTANAPGIAIVGDTDSGLWSSGANRLALSTAGTGRVHIDNLGFVGIGTNAPATMLDVSGEIRSRGVDGTSLWVADAAGDQRIGMTHYGGAGILQAYNGPTETLRLDSGGLSHISGGVLGIGTDTPNANAVMDVNGTGNLSAMIVPRATTAERPVTAANGMIRYNTNLAAFEVYQNNNWATISTSAGSVSFPLLASPTGSQGAPAYSFLTDPDTGMYQTATGEIRFSIDGFQYLNMTPGINYFGTQTLNSATVGSYNIVGTGGFPSAPTYTFNTDTDTGMYRAAANTLGFSTSGSERVRIDSDGNVGIGTTAPARNLHIVGTGNASVMLQPGSSSNFSSVAFNDETGLTRSGVTYWTSADQLGLYGNTVFFGDFGNEYMRVGAGRVGIGTTSPNTAAVLDVNGTGNLSAIIVPRATTAERPVTAANGMIRYNTNLAAFEVYQNNNWATLATGSGTSQWSDAGGGEIYYSTANVGIGTNNPTYKLDIEQNQAAVTSASVANYDAGAGAAAAVQAQSDAGSVVMKTFSAAGGDYAQIFTNTGGLELNSSDPAGFMTFHAGATERMRIAANGNVGIGTNNPDTPLDIASTGNTYATIRSTADNAATVLQFVSRGGAANSLSWIENGWPGDLQYRSANGYHSFAHANGSVYLTVANGNVGIGSTSPNAILDVNGSGSASSMIVPRDSTAARPAGVNGMIRYNTNLAAFEVYANDQWATLATGSGSSDNLGDHTATQQILSTLGTAGAPGVAFVGDTDTGLWSSGANRIALSTGGTGRIFVDQLGNLGVGINSPIANLEVQAGSTSFGDGIAVAPNGSGYGGYFWRDSAGTTANSWAFTRWPDNSLNIGRQGLNGMLGTPSGSTVLTIAPFGHVLFGDRVGITTGSPQTALDVYGTGSASAILVPRDSTAGRPTGVNGMIRYNTNLAAFEVYQNNNWATLTTGPGGGDFMANGSVPMTGAFLATLGTAATPSITFNGDPDTGFWSAGANELAISTGGVERVRVNANGYMGIGTSNPQYALEVYSPSVTGPAQIINTQNGSTGPALIIGRMRADATQPGADSGPQLVFRNENNSNGFTTDVASISGLWETAQTDSTNRSAYLRFTTTRTGTNGERMRITSTGQMGLGTDAPNAGAILDVYGTGNFSSLLVPRGTTAERAVAAANGMIRYNTNLAAFEVYQNNNWATLATGGAGAANIDGLSDGITTGTNNLFLGTSVGALNSGTDNTGVGQGALAAALSGNFNTALGSAALNALTSGSVNTALGEYAANQLTTGVGNVAIGNNALGKTTDGSGNIAIGLNAGFGSTNAVTQNNNTLVGVNIAQALQSASNNTMFGYQAGATLTTGGSNLLIGYNVDVPTAGTSNYMSIGNLIFATGVGTATGTTASNGRVAIGTNVPLAVLDVVGTGTASAIVVPRDTTANRPTSAANGMIRYNTNLAAFEVYANNQWATVATGSGTSQWSNSGSDIYFNTGNVGIGNNTPTYSIDVISDAPARFMNTIANNNSATAALVQRRRSDATAPGSGFGAVLQFNLEGFTNNSQADAASITASWENNQTDDTTTRNAALIFNTAAANVETEKMRIASNGNVGIGTTNPSWGALQVHDNQANTTAGILLQNDAAGSDAHSVLWLNAADADSDQYVRMEGATGNTWFAGREGTSDSYRIGRNGTGSGPGNGDVLTITGSGNVGIGTTGSASPLNIRRDVNGIVSVDIENRTNGADAEIGYKIINHAGYETQLYRTAVGHGSASRANQSILGSYGGSGLTLLTGSSSGDIRFLVSGDTNAFEQMRITSQRVGIGTDAPLSGSRLDVVGTTASNSSIIVPRADTTSRPTGVNGMLRYNTNLAKFEVYQSSQWTQLMTGSGSVGDFMASGSVNMTGTLKATDGTNALPSLTFANDTSTGLFYAGSNVLGVAANGVNVASISANGFQSNVPINALVGDVNVYTPTSAVLQLPDTQAMIGAHNYSNLAGVVGMVWVGANNATEAQGAYMGAVSTAGASTSPSFVFGQSTGPDSYAERMRFAPSGNLGIGTTSPNTGAIIDLNGTGNLSSLLVPRGTTADRAAVAANGMLRYNTNLAKFETFENGNWFQITTSSDARLKKDVEPVANGLAMAELLRPVFFNWDKSNPRAQGYLDKHQVGFIAQELEQVLPEVVIEGADTYRTVEYGKIIPIGIAAIQELSSKQKDTTREIQSLRDENQRLKDVIQSMDERLKKLEQIR